MFGAMAGTGGRTRGGLISQSAAPAQSSVPPDAVTGHQRLLGLS
jgi:hypothetical protein